MSEKDDIKVNVIMNPNSQTVGPEQKSSIQEHKPTEPVAVSPVSEASSEGGLREAAEDALDEAMKQAAENRDRWMRAVADLENFKKRAAQEKSRILKYKNEDLLRDLLPVVDNMDRAMTHCGEAGRSDSLADGLCMISVMLKELLENYGVHEIKAVGERFDPQYHEAIARIPAAGTEANTVVDQMEKGYMYNDRLLRPAKVVVSAAESQ